MVAPPHTRACAAAVAGLKTSLEGEDVDAIKAKTNELVQASMKLGEAMYKAGETGAGPGEAGPAHDPSKDDVIDAAFKDVGPDEHKKAS